MSFHLYEIFNLFGGFLGIILTVVILTLAKGRKSVKISASAVLMVASLIAILGSMLYSGKIVSVPFLLRIDSPIHYLLGPALYFYTLSVVKEDFTFRPVHLVHLLPFLINLIEFIPFYFSPVAEKLRYYQTYQESGTVVIRTQYLLKTLSVTAYFAAQLILFIKHMDFFKGRRILFSWLTIVLSGQMVMILGFAADHLSGLTLTLDPYRFGINMVTLFLYSFAIAILFFPQLLYGNLSPSQRQAIKYHRSGLTDSEKVRILHLWEDYMSGPEKPFLNPRMNLNEAGRILQVRPQQLSQVINEKAGLNFNEYVNHKRVEEAGRLLLSEAQKKLTIEAIAGKSGFHSKASFYAAFRKYKGMTPKEFMLHRKAANKG